MYKVRNLKGDFILIPFDENILPLTGILASIDWNSKLIFSNAIINNLINLEDNKDILLNTEKKLNVNKTIITRNKEDLAHKVIELINNFNAKSFTIIFNNKLKINLKELFKGLKSYNLKYKELINTETKLEKIIYFKEVTYE